MNQFSKGNGNSYDFPTLDSAYKFMCVFGLCPIGELKTGWYTEGGDSRPTGLVCNLPDGGVRVALMGDRNKTIHYPYVSGISWVRAYNLHRCILLDIAGNILGILHRTPDKWEWECRGSINKVGDLGEMSIEEALARCEGWALRTVSLMRV